jgi:hypothetical protein
VSDERDLERVERMLQRTPAPEFVPATAAAAARRAALGEPPSIVTRAKRSWRMPEWWRVASMAAAFGAAVAVAVVLAIGGRGGGPATQFSVSLNGPHGATAKVDFGHPANGVRQMVVHVKGLPPAGAGHYYEMWFRTPGNENVSAVTFDTADGGRATFRAVIPAGMTWHHCWVTREAVGGEARSAMVLTT